MHLSPLILAFSRILTSISALLNKLGAYFHRIAYKRKRVRIQAVAPRYNRVQPKPAWVKHEVLKLKALLPDTGCRKIASLFNRTHAAKRKVTVSKSYVAYTLRQHRYQILILRRTLKHRFPKPVPNNRLWAIDLTGKGDTIGEVHSILGIIDHGSRKLLAIEAVDNKNAWTVLGYVFLAIGRFGKPRNIRSDNEPVFKRRIFRLMIALAGIRQQFTTPGCPWMNGRIERVFGTLKENLDQLKIDGRKTLAALLTEFSFWYNAVRPHQHLNGLTPNEAWHGVDPYAHAPKSAHLFIGWGGMLQGFYLRY